MPSHKRFNLRAARAFPGRTKERGPDISFSVIFDMDGVIVDNRRYHFKAWRIFARRRGIPFDPRHFRDRLFGRTNDQILRGLFNRDLSSEEIAALGEEKEALYRQVYMDRVRPARGLVGLLKSLRAHGVSLAVATAAPRINLDFVLERTGLGNHFDALLDVAAVQQGKPAPEIYLKAAALLKVPPRMCIAVEDSLPGVESALGAGMKVVAITTAHPRKALSHADLVIDRLGALTYETLRALLDEERAGPERTIKEEK